jgi:hypothetical protein
MLWRNSQVEGVSYRRFRLPLRMHRKNEQMHLDWFRNGCRILSSPNTPDSVVKVDNGKAAMKEEVSKYQPLSRLVPIAKLA